jgi:hypothetical protein
MKPQQRKETLPDAGTEHANKEENEKDRSNPELNQPRVQPAKPRRHYFDPTLWRRWVWSAMIWRKISSRPMVMFQLG